MSLNSQEVEKKIAAAYVSVNMIVVWFILRIRCLTVALLAAAFHLQRKKNTGATYTSKKQQTLKNSWHIFRMKNGIFIFRDLMDCLAQR